MPFRKDVACEVCRQKFSTYKPEQRTCSRKCGQRYRTQNATIDCAICQKRFVRRHPKAKFCSKECYYEHRRVSAEIAESMRRRRDFFASREELECRYHELQLSQEEIAADFNVSQKKVWGLMNYYGIRSRTAAKRHQDGALNHAWKGGRIRQGKYRYIKKPDHPNATAGGYVAEHIAIATAHVGRALQHSECVHHLDGDKENNAIENLHITTYSKHGRLHRELEEIAFALNRAGLICFDGTHYKISDQLAEFSGIETLNDRKTKRCG